MAELEAILTDSESFPSEGEQTTSLLNQEPSHVVSGFGEGVQAPLIQDPALRRYEYSRRPCRLPLRMLALRIYNGECIFTSSRQPLSDGRFEAECCHLQPLEHDGPDTIQNIMLMTGIFHTLFDEGLISLGDDLRILVKEAVDPKLRGLLKESGYATVPDAPLFRPALPFIRYHRRFIYGEPS